MGVMLPMNEIVFITSSNIKLRHAEFLCREFDVKITGLKEKSYRASYDEPRIQNRTLLLEQSFNDALERWRKAVSNADEKFFIIEDTSVAIHALSDSGTEVPGLDVKYWMRGKTFEALDAQLIAAGGNRAVTVRSDLLLHIPRTLRAKLSTDKPYICFTGISKGVVAARESSFETNPRYPWLDNKTFNKWFVPNGCAIPISLLPIEVANKHDFRADAFGQMLHLLYSHALITRRAKIQASQINFNFASGPTIFIVTGLSCAGKTTLATCLAKKLGYLHVEASDFMYLSYFKLHGVGSTKSVGDFAEKILSDEPSIVACQIVEYISQFQKIPIVITGFRSPKEIEWFQINYRGNLQTEIIYIDAKTDIRYERSLRRDRQDKQIDRVEFEKIDTQQLRMGLKILQAELLPTTVENNATLDDYYANFEKRFEVELVWLKNVENQPAKLNVKPGLEEVILVTLAAKWSGGQYYTTTEIAALINSQFKLELRPKNKNNVSRYFNQRLSPYYEINVGAGKKRYRLSQTGYGKAMLLDIRQ